jgi:hypothetical protein
MRFDTEIRLERRMKFSPGSIAITTGAKVLLQKDAENSPNF